MEAIASVTNLLRNLVTDKVTSSGIEDSGDGEEPVSMITGGRIGRKITPGKLENTPAKPIVIYGWQL
ncbi:hypothetical protein COLO4_10400 [Corchorus olitorius]|uniref:Uncharacterized protein n=1 Tax=Corchorus olitorius TaxID=93759 RepID=A0A1R3K8U1_9ROSI|nr:hypothetical protein COLO4_10400 [Corchorus olitorius]